MSDHVTRLSALLNAAVGGDFRRVEVRVLDLKSILDEVDAHRKKADQTRRVREVFSEFAEAIRELDDDLTSNGDDDAS